MNALLLTIRLAIIAAILASVLMMIYAGQPRLMAATYNQTSAEIILEAAARFLLNQPPDHVIHAAEALTLELHGDEKNTEEIIFFSPKTADPLTGARVVAWSHHMATGYGCLELFPSVAGFEKNQRGEILGGVCRPLPEAEHIFAMDYLAMTNALNFVANSYISLARNKLLSQGEEFRDELTTNGVWRLEQARVHIVKLAAAHALRLRETSAIVLMVLCLLLFYELVSIYLATEEVAEDRVGQTLRSFFSGEDKNQIRPRLIWESNEKMRRTKERRHLIEQAIHLGVVESVQSALAAGDPERARQIIALAEGKKSAAERAAQAAREEAETRWLFLAQADSLPPTVQRQVEELYDRGNRDGAGALIEHEEEKLFRRDQLASLAKRVEQCLNPVAKDAAAGLLKEAESMLDSKRHDWHKQIYRIENLLAHGNNDRHSSRPR